MTIDNPMFTGEGFPADPEVITHCPRCLHDIYEGENMYELDKVGYVCEPCFSEELMSRSIADIARDMGIDVMEAGNDDAD